MGIGETIIFGMIFLVGLSFLLSQFYHPDRGLLLAQSFPKIETRIVIPDCNSYESCILILSSKYSENEIKQLDLKCENGICTIKGYIEVKRV